MFKLYITELFIVMENAIMKILKNYVFEDTELPYFEIETKSFEPNRKIYCVKTIIPKDHEVFKSEERHGITIVAIIN